MTRHWQAGQTVVVRTYERDRLFGALPLVIVEDTPDLVILYLPNGAPIRWPVATDGGRAHWWRPWRLNDRRWSGGSALWLAPPGAGFFAMAQQTQPAGPFQGWYLNLNEPFRRTADGFVTRDLILDIVAGHDGSQWRWKDKDELESAIARGLIAAERAFQIRAEGLRALSLLQRAQWPFDRDWASWRPDPAWPRPELADGWDRPQPPYM